MDIMLNFSDKSFRTFSKNMVFLMSRNRTGTDIFFFFSPSNKVFLSVQGIDIY